MKKINPLLLSEVKTGFVCLGRNANQTIPVTKVTPYIPQKYINRSPDNLVTFNSSTILVDKRVKEIEIKVVFADVANAMNLYATVWGQGYQMRYSLGQTMKFSNINKVNSSFTINLYVWNSTNISFDNFWNYIYINYIYE